MKRQLFRFLKYIVLFCVLIVVFLALVTLVYALPKNRIAQNAAASIDTLNEESQIPFLPFGVSPSGMDYHTDKLMMDSNILDTPDASALHNAMDVNAYPRYWHGYQVFLRPMLLFGSIETIRYCNMFVMYLLLALVFSAIQRKINTRSAIACLFALVSAYIWTSTISLQFFYPMALTLLSTLFVVSWYTPEKQRSVGYVFFTIGMLTSFIDLLTSPLMALCVPLICTILIDLKFKDTMRIWPNLLHIILLSAVWFTGYLLSWVAKVVLASLLLRENIVGNFISQIFYRSGMEFHMNLFDRLAVVMENVHQYRFQYFGSWKNILLPWLILYILISIPLRPALSAYKKALPLLVVACYPLVWFFLTGVHSTNHSWYTCHGLMISLFSMLSALLYPLDFQKISPLFKRFHHQR